MPWLRVLAANGHSRDAEKGKRGKKLSLVLPEGYEDMLDEDPEEAADEAP